MPKDPIGVLGRLNAASLMMITPEFYKLWSKRAKGAGKINHDLANFSIKPAYMQLDGLKNPLRDGWQFRRANGFVPQSSSSKYPVLRCDVVSAFYQY